MDIQMIAATPLFEGVSEEETGRLLACIGATCRHFEKDECIYHAGEQVSAMGLVLSGSVLLIQEDLWGRRNMIGRQRAGEIFAEPFAASPEKPINLNIFSDEESEILFLNIARILTTCSSACPHHTRVMKNLVAILAGKALALNEKITHMSRKSTREKLLSYLSAVSIREGSLTFDIPYDRQQLADYLCVDRAAMCVELSKLQKQGVLQYRKNHFVIRREAALEY